ncbi:MAG: hypothetical protein HKN76_20175 [Saprospiraceae bacterium]|nr:hypothetical protein [Saprospiraceae bacterium]
MKDKYLEYTVEQLVEDESFARWIRDTSIQNEREKKNWLEQHPQMQEKMVEASMIIKGLNFKEVDVTQISTPKLWQRIEEDIKQTETGQRSNIRFIYYAAAVAASLLLLITFGVLAPSTTIKSEPGTVVSHLLPDQSSVQLNDDSRIKYRAESFPEDRQINLQGEAFFSVVKGSPFVVETKHGTVEVLGTSFNVFSHDNHFAVQCKTGKVKISAENNDLILTAGQSAHLDEKRMLTRNPAPRNNLTWLEGIYQYENAPLWEVANELERQFDVRINLDENVQEIKYTGFFADDHLDKALQSVFWPLKLRAEQKGKIIMVKSSN